MLDKMEKLGCRKSVVGLVIPTGYSFNLDGTSIYLTMAAVFIAQATNSQMDIVHQITLLIVLLLSSKGAAGVTGSGFIVLAATLSAVGHLPVAGLALILGIDRFMIDLFSFPAADDQPSRFQLLEVMENRRATHVHHSRKIDDAFFTMTQQPKNTDTASIPKLFENISHSLKVFYAGRVLQHLFNVLPVIVGQMILRHSAFLPIVVNCNSKCHKNKNIKQI